MYNLAMKLQEFKASVDECIRKAKAAGLTDEEILCEFLEQVRFMTVKQTEKLLSQAKPSH